MSRYKVHDFEEDREKHVARRYEKPVPLYFDEGKICIAGSCLSGNTGRETFLYILKAIGVPAEEVGEDTVCIDDASLQHNLRGKCYFLFAEAENGGTVFSKVKFVIDPELYPGLRDVSRQKRMEMLRDFVAVSLADRLNVMSKERDGAAGSGRFRKTGDGEYESRYVRIRHEMDRYHAVITISYRAERSEEGDGNVTYPGAAELFRKMEALEKRVEAVEKENRELRKVNDLVLDIFGSLKPAHTISSVEVPDDSLAAQITDAAAEEMSPERKNALIRRYFK